VLPYAFGLPQTCPSCHWQAQEYAIILNNALDLRHNRLILAQEQPKSSLEDKLKEEIGRRLESDAKVDILQGKVKSLTETVSRLRKKEGIESNPVVEKKEEKISIYEPKQEVKQEKAAAPTHARSITDAFCPECGEPNTDYKPETWCTNCNRPLGAIANLPKVKNCPSCGATGKIATTKKPFGAS